MEATKIEILHNEHREWLNKVDFYYDDLMVFRRRLDEVAAHNTSTEIMKQVEHFQNQFVIQRNELDELKHAIKAAEHEVFENVSQNGTAVNRRSMADDGKLRERVQQFEKLFHQLRTEFINFLTKTF